MRRLTKYRKEYTFQQSFSPLILLSFVDGQSENPHEAKDNNKSSKTACCLYLVSSNPSAIFVGGQDNNQIAKARRAITNPLIVFCLYPVSLNPFELPGPFPMISGVIVKSGEKFRLDPDYKPAPLPLPFTCR